MNSTDWILFNGIDFFTYKNIVYFINNKLFLIK